MIWKNTSTCIQQLNSEQVNEYLCWPYKQEIIFFRKTYTPGPSHDTDAVHVTADVVGPRGPAGWHGRRLLDFNQKHRDKYCNRRMVCGSLF